MSSFKAPWSLINDLILRGISTWDTNQRRIKGRESLKMPGSEIAHWWRWSWFQKQWPCVRAWSRMLQLGKGPWTKIMFSFGNCGRKGARRSLPNFWALFQELHLLSLTKVYSFKNHNVLNFELFLLWSPLSKVTLCSFSLKMWLNQRFWSFKKWTDLPELVWEGRGILEQCLKENILFSGTLPLCLKRLLVFGTALLVIHPCNDYLLPKAVTG